MYICERCGKGLQVGMNVSHSHRRTKKRSLPNLHLTTVVIGGKKVKARYCTKCLRIIRASHPYVKPESVQVEVKNTVEKGAERVIKEKGEKKTPQEEVATVS